VNDEVSKKSSTRRDFNKRCAIILLFAVIAFVHLPSLITKSLWIEEGRSKNDIVAHILLPCIQFYLMLLCLTVLLWTKPKLIAFDCTWFRWNRSEFIRLPLLVLGVLLIGILVIALAHILHSQISTHSLLCSNRHNTVFWLWLVIRITLLSPIIEEVFWRGYVQSTMTRALGAWVGVIGQAILFGMLHFYYPLLGMVQTCLLGLVFGIWCHKRKTLLPVIIMHVARNSLAITVAWSKWF
jgi:membrane protease YdiL (CAAX protease family)